MISGNLICDVWARPTLWQRIKNKLGFNKALKTYFIDPFYKAALDKFGPEMTDQWKQFKGVIEVDGRKYKIEFWGKKGG